MWEKLVPPFGLRKQSISYQPANSSLAPGLIIEPNCKQNIRLLWQMTQVTDANNILSARPDGEEKQHTEQSRDSATRQ